MSSSRFFNGGRQPTGRSPASELARFEIQKGGKMSPAARYKYILKKRMQAAQGLNDVHSKNKFKGVSDYKAILQKKISESKDKRMNESGGRPRSKRAAEALEQIAMKKAAKEAKAMRKMVIVRAQNFSNGRITAKGKIYDIADNIVGQVNIKNGKMTTMTGWSIGKYKPKNYMTAINIQNAITQHSPYFINLRKMQAMQQGAMMTDQTINLYGPATSSQQPASLSDYYGSDVSGPRQNIGVTAWGAMSNNAWGTFSDNAWGTVGDNAWGTASTDVWGGISGDSLWGQKGPKIWGTGSGKNYLSKLTNFLAAFFGLNTKKNREARREFISQHRAASRSSSSSSAPRTTVRR